MATVAVDPADPYALHKLVFLNKTQTLKMFLAPFSAKHLSLKDKDNIDVKDVKHVSSQEPTKDEAHPPRTTHPAINTLDHHLLAPIHLAVMLNRKDMVNILLKAGANPLTRSGSGWTARQEATSLGDRDMIELLTRYQRKALSGSFKDKAMNLVKQLSSDLDQFYFQLQWEFQSWVPFVSGLCPKDTYHIWKKGNSVRMDTSLVGFENMKWLRGHISIIFRVDPVTGPELVIIDRVKKITQRLASAADDGPEDHQVEEPTDEEIENEVSICFNSDITSTNVPTSAIKFQRAKQGMWGYRTDKSEKVGEFDCAVWKMDGVEFRTRVRTEHLKDEDGKPIVPMKKGSVASGGKGGDHAHESPRRVRGGRHGPSVAGKDGGRDKKAIVFKLGTGMGSSSSVDEKRVPREIHPKRPQALFAPFTEPAASTESLASTTSALEGMQVRSDSPENTEAEKSLEHLTDGEHSVEKYQPGANGVLKKHARSTGTISDDAFFETALEEMEDELEEKLLYRDSLQPPPPTTMTYEEYFNTSKTGEIHLGRPLEQKESLRSFGATLWMYENPSTSTTPIADGATTSTAPHFPLTIDKILPLLEVIGMDNNRLVGKLKEFLQFKLPPGFPIRANIPVYASISADVTFVNYDAKREMEADLFDVPGEDQGYQEGFVIRPGGDDDT
ncbi:Ankyrin repeat domain-containing protein 13C [Gryganskiella cystojenkinii]|nr:Ankyrin repeat domain-containing protein 13C [Gryganskiella cystojenkinii]